LLPLFLNQLPQCLMSRGTNLFHRLLPVERSGVTVGCTLLQNAQLA
jgi:hypothetical protein